MSRRDHLTDRLLRSLTTDRTQEDVWDEDIPGFGVRVSKGGRRTFFLAYHSPYPQGRPARERPMRRLTLGAYELNGPSRYMLAEARRDARAALGQLASGIDPQGPLKKRADSVPRPRGPLQAARGRDRSADIWTAEPHQGTFAALALDWYRLHALPNKRRLRDDEGMLPLLLAAWADRPAESINRRDVLAVVEPIIRRGSNSRAEKVRLLVSAIYNWGSRKTTLVEHNPAAVLAPLAKPGRGERWLREHEIGPWWSYLKDKPLIVRTYLRVTLASLQRPGEVRHMEWTELEPDAWRIPGEKPGPRPGEVVGTKNGLTHLVPLPPAVRTWIEALRPFTGEGRYVFAGGVEGEPLTAPNRVAQRSWKHLGVRWMPQDLRRTGATHLQRLGVSEEVIDRIQNHLAPGVRRHYNMWAYMEERKKALELWAAELDRLSICPE